MDKKSQSLKFVLDLCGAHMQMDCNYPENNISSTQFELKLSNYNLSQRANNKVTVLRVFLLFAEES